MTDHNRSNDLDRIRTLEQAIAYRDSEIQRMLGMAEVVKIYEDENVRRWQEVLDAERALSDQLADALRFHEDRRINPTSRGGPALAAYAEARA